jgi:pyruvate-ferredoxin/flavodoxin oxidoreductase
LPSDRDANEAAASVAYRASEVIAIYPITPASPMGEHCDEWAPTRARTSGARSRGWWRCSPRRGPRGRCTARCTGALATSFTASQGLLLMIPNLFKIAGELTPFVLHVAARTVATHALSIFGDHSDVMACRGGRGDALRGLAQEAQDLAAVAHAATLRARVPFVHFFDGFRTSHELARIASLPDDDLRALMDEPAMIRAHRERALSPDHPVIRGTAQNPDTFFQAREAAEPLLRPLRRRRARGDGGVRRAHRPRYRPFSYAGHPEAERVVVLMGSGAPRPRGDGRAPRGEGRARGIG